MHDENDSEDSDFFCVHDEDDKNRWAGNDEAIAYRMQAKEIKKKAKKKECYLQVQLLEQLQVELLLMRKCQLHFVKVHFNLPLELACNQHIMSQVPNQWQHIKSHNKAGWNGGSLAPERQQHLQAKIEQSRICEIT